MSQFIENQSTQREDRLVIFPERIGITGLQQFVIVDFKQATTNVPPHLHPDAMEICYYARGSQFYNVEDQLYRVNAGSVFSTFPNEVHSSGGKMQSKDGLLYYMVIDTVHNRDSFLGFHGEDASSLAENLQTLPRLFDTGNKLKNQYSRITSIAQNRPDRWKTLLQLELFSLLNALIETGRQNLCTKMSGEIERSLDLIETLIASEEKINLGGIADSLHMSLSYFKQRFSKETGIAPWKYIRKRRIDAAQNMLLEGKSITEIAYRLQFSSTQHFSNSFKVFTQFAPHEWLALQKKTFLPKKAAKQEKIYT